MARLCSLKTPEVHIPHFSYFTLVTFTQHGSPSRFMFIKLLRYSWTREAIVKIQRLIMRAGPN